MSVKTVLSILSHVVHGYVGNRSTVFPLQYSGWDVDAIDTTNFSNHPAYGTFQGKASSPELVESLFEGISDIIDADWDYNMILTGYAPNEAVLKVIHQKVGAIFQKATTRPVWVLDPVLGDNGKLYVLEKVVPVYRAILSSGNVTVVTPNQFEFELLSDTPISSWESLATAFDRFHQHYDVPYVVLSSVILDNRMYSVGFTAAKPKNKIFYIPIDKIDCNFNGCGDLFAALLANAFYSNDSVLTPRVLSDVVVKLTKILNHSYDCEKQITGSNDIKLVKDIRIVSLRHVLLLDNGNDLADAATYL